MKKELPHHRIGSSYGGNQEWFSGFMMKIGGCAAETAIECCIYLDQNFNTKLCPFEAENVTRSDFVNFGEIMKPYLHPRMSGIDSLSIYLEGFGAYLKDVKSDITLSGVEGFESIENAKAALISQIERGIPVPFLCLYHRDRRFKDYEWHWFLINGYESFEDTLMVKAVTYSSWEWLNFDDLWNTGRLKKGGMIVINMNKDSEQ